MTEQAENIIGMRKKMKAQAEHVRRLEKRIRELKQAAAQGELPDELFDGHAVYQETVRHRRNSGLGVRTSPENVSDALDAVVRLIKSRRAAHGGDA